VLARFGRGLTRVMGLMMTAIGWASFVQRVGV